MNNNNNIKSKYYDIKISENFNKSQSPDIQNNKTSALILIRIRK